jgi:DNA repair protein RecN (Recombination protein N)
MEGAKILAPKIAAEMQSLNMPEANFEISISVQKTNESFSVFENDRVIATDKGFDSIQFLLSANPGEALKPLVEIASGGEISRIMLAIKTVFQKDDPINTLVFDEIDSGISGDAAQKVGQSLLNLSHSKQVICITHLPQIARLATHHLHIEKSIANGNTKVKAKYLDESERNNIINHLSSSI